MESTDIVQYKVQQLEEDKKEALATIHDLRTDKHEMKGENAMLKRDNERLEKRSRVADRVINLTQEQRRVLCTTINKAEMTIMSNNVRDMNTELLRNPEAVETNWNAFTAAWKKVIEAKPGRRTRTTRNGNTATTTFFPEERAAAANCA